MATESHLQHYALDQSGKIVDIKEAHEKGGSYFCPHCGGQMIMRCGDIRRWHFSHKGAKCSYDHYLHTLAEIMIRDWFNNSKEINIYLDVERKGECSEYNTCTFPNKSRCKWDRGITTKEFNLKDWYHDAVLERAYKKNGKEFIADILCPCNNPKYDPLFIEIFVKHACEENKILSGLKIIEIKITCEQDIEGIIEGNVPLKAEGVWYGDYLPILARYHWKWNINGLMFHGFKPIPDIRKVARAVHVSKFICLPTGWYRWDDATCKNYHKHKDNFEISYIGRVPWEVLFAKAISCGYTPNQHQLCLYYGENFGYGNICKAYKKNNIQKYCRYNPLPCQYYLLYNIKYKKALEDYEILKNKGNIIDEWIK